MLSKLTNNNEIASKLLSHGRGVALSVLGLIGPACGGTNPPARETGAVSETSAEKTEEAAEAERSACNKGHVVYSVGGTIFRTSLADAKTENLSAALHKLAQGRDVWAASSADGEWLLMETERFDSRCKEWSCLAVVRADLSEGEAVVANGEVIHGDNYGAIASGGNRIVYPASGGPNERDLFVVERTESGWSKPKLLTGDSVASFNLQPALSPDGTRVAFDCGDDPYSQPPTSLCEVGIDGSEYRILWTPEQGGKGAKGRPKVALHHPAYLSDGSVVFEADWNGEQLWKLQGEGPPELIADKYSNDNSPCVLADDCIASLWLGREGGGGNHEIKLMDSEGENFQMLRTHIDVTNTGTSCSR